MRVHGAIPQRPHRAGLSLALSSLGDSGWLCTTTPVLLPMHCVHIKRSLYDASGPCNARLARIFAAQQGYQIGRKSRL